MSSSKSTPHTRSKRSSDPVFFKLDPDSETTTINTSELQQYLDDPELLLRVASAAKRKQLAAAGMQASGANPSAKRAPKKGLKIKNGILLPDRGRKSKHPPPPSEEDGSDDDADDWQSAESSLKDPEFPFHKGSSGQSPPKETGHDAVKLQFLKEHERLTPNNVNSWITAMKGLAVSNSCYAVLEPVFAVKLNSAFNSRDHQKLLAPIDWSAADSFPSMKERVRALRSISGSITEEMTDLIVGVEDPCEALLKLLGACQGTGPVHYQELLQKHKLMRPKQYPGGPAKFVAAFEAVRRTLIHHGRAVDPVEYSLQFVTCTEEEYPTWAADMRRNLRSRVPPSLDAVQADFIDENRVTLAKPETSNWADKPKGGGSKKKPNKSGKAGPAKGKPSGANDGGRFRINVVCTHCLKEGHEADRCFVLHPEQEAAYRKRRADLQKKQAAITAADKKKSESADFAVESLKLTGQKPSGYQPSAYQIDSAGKPLFPKWHNFYSAPAVPSVPCDSGHLQASDSVDLTPPPTTSTYSGASAHFSLSRDAINGVKLDSGSSCHIFNKPFWFDPLDRNASVPSIITGAGLVDSKGQGSVNLYCKTKPGTVPITLGECLYCPQFPVNLVSLQTLYKKGCKLDGSTLYGPEGDTLCVVNDSFMIRLDYGLHNFLVDQAAEKDIDLPLQHTRFGHKSEAVIRETAELVDGIPSDHSKEAQDLICGPCEYSKSQHTRPSFSFETPKEAGSVWTFDSFLVSEQCEGILGERRGIMATELKFGYRIGRSTRLGPGVGPQGVCSIIKHIIHVLKAKPKIILMDNGNELLDESVKMLAEEHHFEIKFSSPYTPEENGPSERSNRIILEISRSWAIAGHVPTMLWPYLFDSAIKMANFTVNNRSRVHHVTPYEGLMTELLGGNHRPNLLHAFTPGSQAFLHIPKEKRVVGQKFDARAEDGILLSWQFTDVTKPFHIFQVYAKDRLGPPINKVVTSSSLTVIESTVQGQVKHLVDSDGPELLDSIEVSVPLHHRTGPPNAAPKTGHKRPRRTQPADGIENSSAGKAASQPASFESFYTVKGQNSVKNRHMYYALYVDDDQKELTLEKALKGPDRLHWKKALYEEIRNLLRLGVFRAADRTRNQRSLTCKDVCKKKLNKDGEVERYKIRTVVRGFEQRHGVDFDQTYAATAKASTWRILITLAASWDWEIDQIDVIAAFLNGDLEEKVLMEIPKGFAEFFTEFPEENDIGYDASRDQVLELLKSLYGLKQAPRQWQKRLKAILIKLGYKRLSSDNAVYISYSDRVIIITYVDDFLIMGPSRANINRFKRQLKEVLDTKDLGPVDYFLGVRIVRDRQKRTILLVQDAYAKKVLHARHDAERKAFTPMASGSLALAFPSGGSCTAAFKQAYQSSVGSLMYAMYLTRPDLAFPVSVLSRYCSNPSKDHLKLLSHTLRYFNQTQNYGLEVGQPDLPVAGPEWDNADFNLEASADGSALSLECWSDSDWKGDKATGRSTYGLCIKIDDSLVDYQSKRALRVMLSSTDAEYHGLAKAAQVGLWMRNLFTELRIPITVTLFGDNQGSIKLANNPEFHRRTQHIPLEEHFIRDEIEKGTMSTQWVGTADQLADGLTKPLPRVKHERMMELLRIKEYMP